MAGCHSKPSTTPFAPICFHSGESWSRIRSEHSAFLYGGSVAIVGLAFAIVAVFHQFSVRCPTILVYLAAVSLSFWYGRKGPGILAFTLSALGLLANFLWVEHQWSHVLFYDAPIICLYVAYVWCIHVFSERRHHKECVLLRHREELEKAVKARTQELSQLNAEYKAMLDAAPFGVALLGCNRIVERCNPAYERMLGYESTELLGRPAPLPEEEREVWIEQEELLRTGKNIVEQEAVRLRRDGSRFHVTLWIKPLQNSQGDYRGLVGFILDNTERNAGEAERQMLTTLVERSPDFVAVTDDSGRLKFINRAGRLLLGLSENDDILGINFLEWLQQEPQNNSEEEDHLSLREGDHVDVAVLTRISSTGEKLHLSCASFLIPPRKPGSSILRAFVGQDVTKRKEAECRLKLSLQENGKLLEVNKALQEQLQHENISLQERNLALQNEIADIQRKKFDKIVGESAAIRQTLNRVEQVASTDVTVLITGETGTGKELIAQAIHENSKRAERPFRAINCGALPATLMASELFGHERGAFTGADKLRLGQFELASGGTLFLDEIGELPLETQAMLLRVLEERSFERLGGTKSIRSDVRIIVATNRDLHIAIQRGEFRQDLYFRLHGFRIEVPPLRERKEDIPLLVQNFVTVSSKRHEKNIRHIEKRAMEMLLTHSWPGNIRELRNVIDISVIVSPKDTLVIDEELLFGVQNFGEPVVGSLKEKLELYERNLIERALSETHGRVSGASGAAALLGMPPSTLSTRLQVLKIEPLRFRTLP